MERQVFEPHRSLAALDDDQMVGTTLAYSFGLTVPGGSVDAAGISAVAVLPSHRRRGILSALMRRQLADIAAGGEPVAALFASEAAIYGRYGYGMAAAQHDFVIHRDQGKIAMPPPGIAASLRLAEPKAVVAELKLLYDTVRAGRPGMVTRTDSWWDILLADPEFMRDGSCPLRCVIAGDRSGIRGYALYSVRGGWDPDGIPDQVLTIRELLAADPAACAALWADLLSRDLVSQVRTRMRPVDDPLPHLLGNPRSVRAKVSDGLWIRLVDIPGALTSRRYACAVDVVIEVADDLLPGSDGRWRLQAGGPADPAAPACDRTTSGADLTLPVAALGAAYLGGTRLGALAAAGLITEHRPGALAALSAAMWWDPAPWAPTIF